MADARARSLDHRHRHRVLPRRRRRRALAGARRRDAATSTPRPSRPISSIRSRRSISTSRSRRRATSARWRRGSGSAPTPPGSRSTAAGVKGNAELLAHMDMIVAAGGGERDIAVDGTILTGMPKAAEPGCLSQRTADERSAADIVPGAALQSARRQYFDRAWRHRLVAHLHGRGIGRRRRGAHRARAHRRRTERHRAGRRLATTASARTCCCSTSSADICCAARSAGVGARANGMVLGSLGAFLVLEARSHAEARGAKPLARLSSRACRSARAGPPAPSPRRLARMWQRARAAAQSRAHRGDLGRQRRGAGDRRRARLARRPCRTCRCAPPAPISGMVRAAIRHERCACRARARSR